MNGGEDAAAAWADVARACALLAVDPCLGGMSIKSRPGAARDRVCAWVRALLPDAAPFVRIPSHVTPDRLFGGLSLAATLAAGKVVAEDGVLARAHGGAIVLSMAERVEAHVAGALCAAIDRGEITLERDGITASATARFFVLALDEGIDDEQPPPSLLDRLAFHVALDGLAEGVALAPCSALGVVNARARLAHVTVDDEVLAALGHAAVALGVASLRSVLLAASVARANAALDGRTHVDDADAMFAARLVLAPRATRAPAEESEAEEEQAPDHDDPPPDDDRTESPASEDRPLEDLVLAAAKSALEPGILDALAAGLRRRQGPKTSGKAGARRMSAERGRPAGTRQGAPGHGERLNVVETLRAAAPWQKLRGRHEARRRVEVRKADFRVSRFVQTTETSVIFCVDASGSSALQRLAEAKGAVEQVLADCYVRRDHVALIAFRGARASLLLPPTRSLARVRKCLADLAGGGTTPLAAGIESSLTLALDARRRGQTPVVVLMTDGRANVARAGHESVSAFDDALAAARALRVEAVSALFLDTAPRPRPEARRLADALGARYVALPYVDSAGISRHVHALADGAS